MKTQKAKKTQVKKLTNISALELHEQICAIRYENIEKRMESGSHKFVRIEAQLWGLYAAIIGMYILEKFI